MTWVICSVTKGSDVELQSVNDSESYGDGQNHCDHDHDTMTWRTGARGETQRSDYWP
jgi:hypothetical protein